MIGFKRNNQTNNMKKLILLLLFIPLVFSCSDGEEILGTPVLVITNENAKPLVIQVTYD